MSDLITNDLPQASDVQVRDTFDAIGLEKINKMVRTKQACREMESTGYA